MSNGYLKKKQYCIISLGVAGEENGIYYLVKKEHSPINHNTGDVALKQ